MYPGTIFNWFDQSGISSENEVAITENAPLFLAAASFDKGPEDMRIVSGQQFYRLYGNTIDFEKHGQAALQIKNIIDNGGRVLIKRIVDSGDYDKPTTTESAKLANIVFVANVHVDFTLKQDPNGKDINEILAPFGISVTADPNKYVLDKDASWTDEDDDGEPDTPKSKVKWTTYSFANTVEVDIEYITNKLSTTSDIYNLGTIVATKSDDSYHVTSTVDCKLPVIVVADNGRGYSKKAVRFMPDYNTSKNMDNFFYAGYVFEGTDVVGKTIASINPDTVINGVNYSFGEQESEQVQYDIYDQAYERYINVLAGVTGFSVKEMKGQDILRLISYRKQNLNNIILDEESVDLDAPTGIALVGGSNGRFGDYPIKTVGDTTNYPGQEYVKELLQFFSGGFTDAIYDLDQYKIAAVVDANYPLDVKKAISSLVTFREDCFFFRDYGIDNLNTFTQIQEAQNRMGEYNKFIGDYFTTYEIYDPYNGKRIKVTMLYDLAGVLVNHFATGAHKPVAGIANNIILRSAIKGSLNFTPRITPLVNQKSLLEDIKVNYAIFDQDQCVCQSLYTTQEEYTQLSFINNVLAIQEVARAVRSSCPKFRYTFTSGIDFSQYASEVSSVLSNYRNNFAELSFQYQQSAVHASQKIFYATIKFRFNNWAQTEIFDLYALPNENVGQ